MLTQSVDIEPFAGLDDSGAPTFGSTVTGVDAYVARDIEVSGDTEGISGEVVTRVILSREVDEGSRIHLPSGDVMEVMATVSLPSTDGRETIYKAMGG
jgi:hypothetical protein